MNVLTMNENGDVMDGDNRIISREYGYDRVNAALIAEMVEAWNQAEVNP